MSYDPSAITAAPTKQHLAPPQAHHGRRPPQKLPALACHPIDDFLSSELDVDLERSFASTMSLNSPSHDPEELPEPDCSPMNISPAPERVLPQDVVESSTGPKNGRGRSATRAATMVSRLFGRDMSNGSSSLSSAKTGTSGVGKRLQRSALPVEWLVPVLSRNENAFNKPQDRAPSPASDDDMDVDSSFVDIPSREASRERPQMAAPSAATFDFTVDPMFLQAPASAAPTATEFKGLFYGSSPPRSGRSDEDAAAEDLANASMMSEESPMQPFTKKRRSTSPQPDDADDHHDLLAAPLYESSPAASSPVARKLERMASAPLRKPMFPGLGAPPFGLNVNKKRPRRPVLSAVIAPGHGPLDKPLSAYPAGGTEHAAPRSHAHALPPVRRAVSAMLPPSVLEDTLASELGDFDGPDVSSPAQAYAKRQQVKTIRRCDGIDDFRPTTGARRDADAALRAPRRSEDRESRAAEPERDTPRSKYLHASPGLGSFGDNEAHGKILPCHRVREDGLMRVNCKTLDELLDGVFDSQLASYHIIDCRFDYEYNGGHIAGAVNINTTAGVEEYLLGAGVNKPVPSTSGDASKKTVLIFHCEFSAKRAPTFAKHLRSKDRALNNHVYPKIHYPEVYILEGGYCQYFQESGARCQPAGYVQMDDPHYAASRKEDMDHFRKGKFGRTKSYAYGEGKMLSLASQQLKRNTAPSGGTPALFAAANAARTRRGGSAGLQMLPEDKTAGHHSDEEDTDIGDSPCPPPSKNLVFKGKKLNRLIRAETFGPERMIY